MRLSFCRGMDFYPIVRMCTVPNVEPKPMVLSELAASRDYLADGMTEDLQ